ncbi:MAG TPA: type II secretion system F family protein [Xanthobacteraceae bacterium]|nr:type II secretion system F family protein [Xanthobacteraceae bacterium]
MSTIFDSLVPLGEDPGLLLTALVFLASASLAFGVMAMVQTRGAVKRRAAGISGDIERDGEAGGRSLRDSGLKAAQRLIEYTNRHYSSVDDDNMKLLRRRLVQAGIFDARAVGFYFLARAGLAIALAAAVFIGLPMVLSLAPTMFWILVGAAGLAGYLAPTFYLDRLTSARRQEYRSGFPDFMDLLVVCADAGLSMEAALERVGRELADSYPTLSANIHMTNLEIRAGRTLSDALDHLSERLGLDEVRSFATLIQQSIELGSSVTDALRVYSEDMRHKRLSRAEEKAYSLPVKLSLPLMACIFPVLFVVILLPVVVRIKMGFH